MLCFSGIRGGFVQASIRYAKANSFTMEDYDKIKDDSWIFVVCRTILKRCFVYKFLHLLLTRNKLEIYSTSHRFHSFTYNIIII